MAISEDKLRIYDRVLATFSSLALLIGGFWTVWEVIETKDKENYLAEQKVSIEKFNEKKSIYYELCEAESEIAACNTYDEVVMAQKHFRKLFFGKAHMISYLDAEVNNQKIDFRDSLDNYLFNKPKIDPIDYFGGSVLALSDICNKKLNVDSLYKSYDSRKIVQLTLIK
ncbi:hypothetical protein KBK19_15785 [Microvirga sp. STR05]|uniref:Uncharacterized protein n=1 Tax=Hymenobacter duratus TaxID=2771356 RepID=A0ABR8JLA4_9BACT|nr:hypothetical protein [Hymenobacter duratus]MBD2716503.1 hypothetical protein [Hymenobacter duratus]MBR7951418.1 hypothetical protein [Microvirga sp. STR05]